MRLDRKAKRNAKAGAAGRCPVPGHPEVKSRGLPSRQLKYKYFRYIRNLGSYLLPLPVRAFPPLTGPAANDCAAGQFATPPLAGAVEGLAAVGQKSWWLLVPEHFLFGEMLRRPGVAERTAAVAEFREAGILGLRLRSG